MDWSDDIELILDNVRKNSIRLNNYHIKRFYHFKSYGKYFRIPLIFLNSLGSVCSVGLQPYMEQKSISLTTCLIAMMCGLITSLELYLSIQSSMESHLKCAKDFYTLSIDIYKTLELSRELRGEGWSFNWARFWSHFEGGFREPSLLLCGYWTHARHRCERRQVCGCRR